MISLRIIDVKDFMNKLLVSDTFDSFCLIKAHFVTANTFDIDGKINKEFFGDDETSEDFSLWRDSKHFCREIIKGKKLPLEFKIVLSLNEENKKKVIESVSNAFAVEEVKGLYMNIIYTRASLHLVTGTSFKTFTLDKTLENEWDKMAVKFLKNKEIPTEEE